MKRVGIFSGTFDPIHVGHIIFAKQALKEAKLDKVFFLVEPSPRRKQGVHGLEHREAMVRLAIQKEPKLGSIMLEHARFSVKDTLPVLRELYKGAELHLLFGDDILSHLAEWPHVKRLTRDVHFVIGVRQKDPAVVQKQIEDLQKLRVLQFNYVLFQSLAPDITSSKIRLALKRDQKPQGLSKKVLEYIHGNGLYSSGSNS